MVNAAPQFNEKEINHGKVPWQVRRIHLREALGFIEWLAGFASLQKSSRRIQQQLGESESLVRHSRAHDQRNCNMGRQTGGCYSLDRRHEDGNRKERAPTKVVNE